MLKRVVVTGGNKGIGYAITKALLSANYFVFLGSRDANRGHEAVKSIVSEEPKFAGLVQMLQLDVTDDASVTQAVETVRKSCSEDTPLMGLINNAGGTSKGKTDFSEAFNICINLNFYGVKRTTTAFLPLLDPTEGRVVMISSAAGPSYVAKCSAERQQLFVDPNVSLSQITGLLDECKTMSEDTEDTQSKFTAMGLHLDMDTIYSFYGLSKACVNMYTQLLAREHPSLKINACTPGFIETDLTRALVERGGKTPAEMGMKSPTEATVAPLYLMLGDPPGNGRYYGSDAVRSPLDRYRGPGDPPFEDDAQVEEA